MDYIETDPRLTPTAVRLAQPFVDEFIDSLHCPPTHRWHARSTLVVLALWVGISTEPADDGSLGWADLDPDGLFCASLECDSEDLVFLRDLLDVSSAFYGYLADEGLVPRSRANGIRARLTALAMGLRSA